MLGVRGVFWKIMLFKGFFIIIDIWIKLKIYKSNCIIEWRMIIVLKRKELVVMGLIYFSSDFLVMMCVLFSNLVVVWIIISELIVGC